MQVTSLRQRCDRTVGGNGTSVRERAWYIEGQRMQGQEEPPRPHLGQVFRVLGCVILSELQFWPGFHFLGSGP